jgi:hypothetical protein
MAQSRHSSSADLCPLSGVKQTLLASHGNPAVPPAASELPRPLSRNIHARHCQRKVEYFARTLISYFAAIDFPRFFPD